VHWLKTSPHDCWKSLMYVAQCAIFCVLSASEKEICSETNQKRETTAEN